MIGWKGRVHYTLRGGTRPRVGASGIGAPVPAPWMANNQPGTLTGFALQENADADKTVSVELYFSSELDPSVEQSLSIVASYPQGTVDITGPDAPGGARDNTQPYSYTPFEQHGLQRFLSTFSDLTANAYISDFTILMADDIADLDFRKNSWAFKMTPEDTRVSEVRVWPGNGSLTLDGDTYQGVLNADGISPIEIEGDSYSLSGPSLLQYA